MLFRVLFIAAVLAVSAYAQGKENYVPVAQPIPAPKGKTTRPVPINESDRKRACPPGYQFVGKQCAQTLTAPAEQICPAGTSAFDGKCAKFYGKREECPPGYEATGKSCQRSITTEPEIICPPGYVLTSEDTCSKRVPLPPRAICPPGSVAKGDQCVKTITEAPQEVCAPGYTLEGKRCLRDETFDCTPPRRGTGLRTYKGKQHGHTGKKGDVDEYVLQSTCKRVISENPKKICVNGVLEGKYCVIEVPVEPTIEGGRFTEESVRANKQCPPGFQGVDQCINIETAPPVWFCPPRTIDLGDRCAIFSPPKTICPPGFGLDNDNICVKTIFANPIVEYTVTYTCTGKNCGNH